MNSISIIVPFLNRQLLLQRTLDSFILQTVLPDEIILVDNGSIDDSLLICNEFAEKYRSNVLKIVVVQELKAGANSARNKGTTLASSDYLLFFDSDDILLPFAVEELKKCIREKSDIDLIIFPISLRKPTGEEVLRNRCFKGGVVNHILRSVVSTQSMIIRRSFLLTAGGWNENVFRWQDWELGVRMFLLAPKIYFLNELSLVVVWEHTNSITGLNFSDSHQQLATAISEVELAIDLSMCDEKVHLLCLLEYKKIHLAGLFYQEGKADLALIWFRNVLNRFELPLYRKFLYHFIFIYVKLGGRASWILAKLFV